MMTINDRQPASFLMGLAKEYFGDKKNIPFTMAGILLHLGLDLPTMKKWAIAGEPEQKELVWFIRYTVLAGMEKGDKFAAPNSSLYANILNRYFDDEVNAVDEDDFKFVIEVIGKNNE